MDDHPVPLLLITGATGAGKTAFIHRLTAAQPVTERWVVLDNDSGRGELTGTPRLSVVRLNACACCTGATVLRTTTVQLLRRVRPQRFVLEASAAAEPAALLHALVDDHLVRAVSLARHLHIVSAAQWISLPAAAQARLLGHMQAADLVVIGDAAAGDAMRKTLLAGGIIAERITDAGSAIHTLLNHDPACLPPLPVTD